MPANAVATKQEPALPQLSDNVQFMQMIERLATSTKVDVAKLSAMLDLKDRMLAKEAETSFNEAFSVMAGELPRIKKNGAVEYPKNKNQPDGPKEKAFNFAKWEDMDAGIRPNLGKHGFWLSFDTEDRPGGGFWVIGALNHVNGHKKTARFPVTIDSSGGKNNLQGAGSSLSYGKRYTTESLLNLVREGDDDDGVKGGMELIDGASQCILNALIDETKADRAKFLGFMGVKDVDLIQIKDYPKAINALMSKKQQKAQPKTSAPARA